MSRLVISLKELQNINKTPSKPPSPKKLHVGNGFVNSRETYAGLIDYKNKLRMTGYPCSFDGDENQELDESIINELDNEQ